MQIEKTDRQTVMLSVQNVVRTNKEISGKLHKSIATIYERVRRLTETGYILRTVAILDRKKINRSLIAFSQVLLNDHAADTLKQFETEIAKFPEVLECFQM